MAIYHLHAKFIQRSAGGSAIAAAAYRTAQKLQDDRLGVTQDFERKMGVVHTELLAPDDAPDWAQDRERLWNAAEKAERRCDGQPGREVRVALPKELALDEQVELLRSFCQTHFVDRGLVADVAIHHDDLNNPHAHIGLTTRPLSPEGFGPKDRSAHTPQELRAVRKGWSLGANNALQRAGHAARIDHRSYQDQGLRVLPSEHVGINRHQHGRQPRDMVTDRLRRNDLVAHQNGEAILKDPTIALEALTHHEATFTRRKAAVWLSTHTLAEAQFQACLHHVMNHPQVVHLGTNDLGIDVFSTRSMLDAERQMLSLGAQLAQSADRQEAREAVVEAQAIACGFSTEQKTALHHIARHSGNLALVEGLAGAGKSTLFQAARRIWEQQGRRVVGMALSGKAAEGLGASAGIGDCRSIAAWEWAWNKERDQLQRGDVVVVDEAGMVGTRQMGRLLAQAHQAGAKVVLAGDSEQLLAVEAGSPFAELGSRNAPAFLRTVRRQQQAWQRAATEALARGETAAALRAYHDRGAVHARALHGEACDALVERYAAYAAAHPTKQQLALSVRKKDVTQLNACIRAHRAALGELGAGRAYSTTLGPQEFASGDRLCFLRNDSKLGVKNGTLGTVETTKRGHLVVRLDGAGHRAVTVDTRTYRDLAHGYALTVHKAQGVTVDHTHVLASTAFDRRSSYVAMTRHREGLDVYFAKDTLNDLAAAQAVMGRARTKALAISYEAAVQKNQDLRATHAGKTPWDDLSRPSQESLTARPIPLPFSSSSATAQSPESPFHPSPRQAFENTEQGRVLRDKVRFAAATRSFWQAQEVRLRRAHPIAAKLGLVGRYRVQDPISKKPIPLQEGLLRSKKMEEVVQRAYERAWGHFSSKSKSQTKFGQNSAKPDGMLSSRHQVTPDLSSTVRASLSRPSRTSSRTLSFDQALQALPEVQAITRRLEAAIREARHLKRPHKELAVVHASPTEAEHQALRDVREARKGLKELLRQTSVQQEASQRVSIARDTTETEMTRKFDIEPHVLPKQEKNIVSSCRLLDQSSEITHGLRR